MHNSQSPKFGIFLVGNTDMIFGILSNLWGKWLPQPPPPVLFSTGIRKFNAISNDYKKCFSEKSGGLVLPFSLSSRGIARDIVDINVLVITY